MSRVTLLEPADLPEAMRQIHDSADGAWGIEHTARAFGHHPELLQAYLTFFWPWHTGEGAPTKVDPRTKELCRLRIAELNGCVTCASYRYQPTLIEESEAKAAMGGDGSPLTERERVAVAYAEMLAINHHAIDDAYIAGLREHFDEAQLLELSMMIGQYIGFGRVLATLQLETTACPI
jgi:alkylhydroperoxidase family enzyme